MSQRFHHCRTRVQLLAIGVALATAMVGPLAIGANGEQKPTQTKAHESSGQPVEDSWITTKVKADLLVDEQTKGLDINVSTTNGIVTLAGRLDSAAQVDKAVSIARGIKGVKSVDATTLTVKPRG